MRGPTQRGNNNKMKSRLVSNGKGKGPTRNPKNNNRPRDPRKPRVNIVKPAAYVARSADEQKYDEVDDAWAGLTVEKIVADNPQLGQIAVEELYKLPPEKIAVNTLHHGGHHSFFINGIQIPAAHGENLAEPPAKKQKGEEAASKPLKRCAHIDINGACAFYDCPLVMSDDIDTRAQNGPAPANDAQKEVPMLAYRYGLR